MPKFPILSWLWCGTPQYGVLYPFVITQTQKRIMVQKYAMRPKKKNNKKNEKEVKLVKLSLVSHDVQPYILGLERPSNILQETTVNLLFFKSL